MQTTPSFSLSALILATALGAQAYEEGHSATVRALPSFAYCALALSPSSVVCFTGTKLVLLDGTSSRDLLTFASPVFGSFTARVAPNTLLFAESSTHGVWLVPLDRAAVKLATVPYAYDACAWTPTHALVSAKTGGFPALTNDILALDLATGAVDPIAEVPGASGPLAIDADGNLLYVTASLEYPPPAGSSDVLLFGAAKVLAALGPTKLGIADAKKPVTGLHSAGYLALDGDHDAFVTDWQNHELIEIDDVDGPAPRVALFASFKGAPVDGTGIGFIAPRAATKAVFEPFQPEDGGMLVVHESSFTTGTSQLRFVRAARPVTVASVANPIPPGRFNLVTTGGPANGVGVVMIGLGAPAPEITILLKGAEQPIFLTPTLQTSLLAVFGTTFDARGQSAFGLVNPGVAGMVKLTAQVACLNPGWPVLGSAAPVGLDVR